MLYILGGNEKKHYTESRHPTSPPTAIDNLEAMLAPELGVDAVLIGPHDLSCNLGVPEQYQHHKFQEAVKAIFRKARKAGVRI